MPRGGRQKNSGNPGKARATQQATNIETILNQQMIDAIREILGLEPLYTADCNRPSSGVHIYPVFDATIGRDFE